MAGDVAYALSRVSVTVNGRTLSNLRGAAKPDIIDQAATRIMGGGRKGLGWNEFPDANGVDYPFTIAAPSADEHFLDSLAASSADVTIIVAYTDVTDWPVGAYTGITGRGKLARAPRTDGDEIGENAYTVMVNGFSMQYNGAPSITKT